MFFLNLTAAEFFALLGTLSSLIAALYLLDRARRRRIVSTLQFWAVDTVTDQRQARRKMRDPWSLILQLLSLLLLLLAAAHVEWGGRERRGRDHVLLLDDSSWTAAQAAGGDRGNTVLQREKDEANRYFDRLSPGDRAMLVAADSIATPLTRFTRDRQEFEAALAPVAPNYAALNLAEGVVFAQQAQRWSERKPGEIVYVGPGIAEEGSGRAGALPDRALPVAADRKNSGIRQFTVEEVPDEADTYRALVRVKNYSDEATVRLLAVSYGETAFALRRLTLPANGEQTAEYTFQTRGAGKLTASLQPGDSLAMDDRASLFLPQNSPLRVLVYTDRPQIVRPLLAANRELVASFATLSQFAVHPAADVVVLDRFAPDALPALPSLWIDPPLNHSPAPVKGSVSDALVRWAPNSVLDLTVRAKPLRVAAGHTYQSFEGDEAVAGVDGSPVVLFRSGNSGHGREAIVGFDPAAAPLRFEVATPLLFATLLEQLNPLAFRTRAFAVQPVGLATVALDREEQRSTLRVASAGGSAVPFTRRGSELQLFVRQPETVRITSEVREHTLELRLPALGNHTLPLAKVAVGLPGATRFARGPVDFWKPLALAAAACLLLEWFLFGPGRRRPRGVANSYPAGAAGARATRKREGELVPR